MGGQSGSKGGRSVTRPWAVVCPAYNRSAPIAATIESVLKQTRGEFELLVGSDGSTDDTDDLVAGFARADRRVKFLRPAHTGDPGWVRNRLCREAGYGYVAYIDHNGSGACLLGKTAEGPGHLASTEPHIAFTMDAFPGGHDGWSAGIAAPLFNRGLRPAMKKVLRTRFP